MAAVGDVAVAGQQAAAAASHGVGLCEIRNSRRWIGLTTRGDIDHV